MSSALFGFFFTLILVRVLIPFAPRLGLIASPGQHRNHDGVVPLVGGIAMTVSAGVSILFFQLPIDRGILGAVGLLLLVGVLDDRFSLPYLSRFVAQIFAVWLIIHFDGVRLLDLGKVFSPEMANLGQYSTALTIFATVGVINAINMVDGMDGLAGVMVLICLIAGFYQIMLIGASDFIVIGLLIAVVAGFLVFNLPGFKGSRASTFMGDAGSTVLGFLLAWLLIRYSQGQDRAFPPVLALWMLAMPLFDAVGVLLRRLVRFDSPFQADRSHTHHVLLQRGFKAPQVLIILGVVSLIVSVTGVALFRLGVKEHVLFYIFIGLFICYILFMELSFRQLNTLIQDESDKL